jgi:hypothetical protein
VTGTLRLVRWIDKDNQGVDQLYYEVAPAAFVPFTILLDELGNPTGTGANPFRYVDATDFTTLMDYDGSGNLIYAGRAVPGTSTGAAAWQIKRYTYSGTNLTAIEYANGATSYTAAWTGRAGLAYS